MLYLNPWRYIVRSGGLTASIVEIPSTIVVALIINGYLKILNIYFKT